MKFYKIYAVWFTSHFIKIHFFHSVMTQVPWHRNYSIQLSTQVRFQEINCIELIRYLIGLRKYWFESAYDSSEKHTVQIQTWFNSDLCPSQAAIPPHVCCWGWLKSAPMLLWWRHHCSRLSISRLTALDLDLQLSISTVQFWLSSG